MDASDEWGCLCDNSYPCGCKLLNSSDVCVGENSCYDEASKL